MKRNSVLKTDMGNITIKVVLQGFKHSGSFHESSMHNHAAFEFHMLFKGTVTLETAKKDIPLQEGDSVLIPPEVFHSFKSPNKGAAILSFTFFVEKNRKRDGADYERLIDTRLKTTDFPIVFSQNLQIAECVTKILSDIYINSLVSEDRVRAHFTLLFSEIFSLLDERTDIIYDYDDVATENDTRIFMIEEYFNEYYMENITLKNLSEYLYLSEKQTDKIIRKAFGEGFRDHLANIRLHIAKKLLSGTDAEIREIAESVGYQSYNGFYLIFKKKLGITPQKYRNIKRGIDC